MRERARFVVVTDDMDYALADLFASARTNAPSWARVTDDPAEILSLPAGCKVHIAVWRSRHMQSGAEHAWRERRLRGDLVFLADDEMTKIAAWRARRAAGDRAPGAQAPEITGPAELASLHAVGARTIQQWT